MMLDDTPWMTKVMFSPPFMPTKVDEPAVVVTEDKLGAQIRFPTVLTHR